MNIIINTNKFSVIYMNIKNQNLLIENSNNETLNEELINKVIYNQKIMDNSINELNAKIDNIYNFINNNFNYINDNVNINLVEIKKDILKFDELNNDLADRQVNEIRNLSGVVEDKFAKFDELINETSHNQYAEIQKINENYNNFYEIYVQNQDNIQKRFDSQENMSNKLNNAIDLFVLNYEECKKCFFNDNEHLLKNYLDTDDLFRSCYFNNIQFLTYSPSENKILLRTKEGIILSTNNRFYTIKEVIGFDGYSVPQLYQFDDFVVFDIGMNRAYASLRFAEFKNCTAVYGFEIDKDTYDKAIYNISLNPNLAEKITTFNFGLSNIDENVELYYLDGADGVNTVEFDLVDIQHEMKARRDDVKSKEAYVKKTSEILENIIKSENITSKIVLKIDTEGSEYNIIDDLIDSGLIYKMDLIVGEGHKFNDRNLADDLLNIGFKEIENKDSEIVYNFAFVKEEFYDIWPLKK